MKHVMYSMVLKGVMSDSYNLQRHKMDFFTISIEKQHKHINCTGWSLELLTYNTKYLQ